MARTRKPKTNDRPAPAHFEFCVTGPALSAQTKDKQKLKAWQARVSDAARDAWKSGDPPFTSSLRLEVTEFSEFRRRDRDNVAKPIADALQGIVLVNDRQIHKLVSNWEDLNGEFRVRYVTPVVAAAFSNGEEFVRIRVWIEPPARDLGA
jgi:hypothetical protein